jgi:hypothetical protein
MIKQAQARERQLVPNARARVDFANGSIKVLRTYLKRFVDTKSEHKI